MRCDVSKRNVKVAVALCVMVLYQQLLGGTEEHHEKLVGITSLKAENRT
jgi:hypothetical protein